jgi:hypothetical protein
MSEESLANEGSRSTPSFAPEKRIGKCPVWSTRKRKRKESKEDLRKTSQLEPGLKSEVHHQSI